jgi:hypothetical protein
MRAIDRQNSCDEKWIPSAIKAAGQSASSGLLFPTVGSTHTFETGATGTS